jgi:hypothetical protein
MKEEEIKSSVYAEKTTPCTLYSLTIVLRASDLDTNPTQCSIFILLESERGHRIAVCMWLWTFFSLFYAPHSTYTLSSIFFSGANFNINIRHEMKKLFLLLNLNVSFYKGFFHASARESLYATWMTKRYMSLAVDTLQFLL